MSDKMREALAWCARALDKDHPAAIAARAALAEQPGHWAALKPGQYVIQYHDDGEFGQATGWLYRDGGHPCVLTGEPVYVWRRLRDLIRKPPAPAVPDEWRDAFIAMCAAWDGCDRFVGDNFAALGDAVVRYPVLQGTKNQMAARRIARLPYDGTRAAIALGQIAALLAAAPEAPRG